MPASWSLVIHGGAGRITRDVLTPEQDAGARAALDAALTAGSAILALGGHALDAIEAAVRVLEDDPHFNAGRGACFTHEGTIELDAAIMDGRDRRAGSVAGATRTRNPVSLARRVMEASPHVLLAGPGADRFAVEQGLPQVDPDWFHTDERRRQLDELLSRDGDAFDSDMKYGTVGAVARDMQGHVAAATSTGGVTAKRWGRIGDSPLIGAGTFADDRACAVSCTGSGEVFIRVGVGHEIAARRRFTGEDVQAAADAVLAEVRTLGGTGGTIVAAPDGSIAWSMTTAGMYRGRATGTGEHRVAIYADEG
ncbi:isoaspartyl peptidase/L-asparaginase family protein [Sphingomonas sp. Leaf21]|uniref:isoaspartyl peptidase/L-asparaginase family protein n=1 Tax=Sphingomonas sp. Leaf21 TaxID=2876550 RepID=UPI001E40066F|nr:isoaspartyl peptidase/L-asparaginase [Sphingomonas sp. Leaf21]